MEFQLQTFITSAEYIANVRNLDPLNPVSMQLTQPVTGQQFTIIMSLVEPTISICPINGVWIDFDPTSSMYMTAWKLTAAVPANGLNNTWTEVTTYDGLFDGSQYYALPVGPPGPQGAQGAQGNPGPKGDPGPPGSGATGGASAWVNISAGSPADLSHFAADTITGFDAYASTDMPVSLNGSTNYYTGLAVGEGGGTSITQGFQLITNWGGGLGEPQGTYVRIKDQAQSVFGAWERLIYGTEFAALSAKLTADEQTLATLVSSNVNYATRLNNLETNTRADEANIATLQTTVAGLANGGGNGGADLTAVIKAEAADAINIATLQSQVLALQTNIPSDIATQLSTLTTNEANDAIAIAALQKQVNDLTGEIVLIAALQTPMEQIITGNIRPYPTSITLNPVVGTVMAVDPTGAIVPACANSLSTSETIGLVTSNSGDTFTVLTSGWVDIFNNIIPGTVYYLSDVPANAGTMVAVAPTASGHVNKPILLCDGTTSGFILSNMRGYVNA